MTKGAAHEHIVDIDVSSEMERSFLEYAYSVIYSRAIPDARDGLKPVQRRILFQMDQMGLRPDRGHVKSARVVGEVMGKLHPHGDQAIYDALVRLAQPWAMRVPLVDGHGNFGSLDYEPAASRYTEARLAAAALDMTRSLDENAVDFVPNYDSQYMQPEVLPAAFPNLLVNGATGIAVGMATNMAPHNLGEVVAAARHLIANPDATLEDLIKFVPGPDLPSGGKIIGLDGVREAYANGRGSFKTRAKARIENVTARKRAIVVTELPYGVGPEKVIDRISQAVASKKVSGISAITDLSDRKNGLRLVIEVRSAFRPEAVLEELYRLTPLEENFAINNVALVDGEPKTLGLRELLSVYVDFKLGWVRRRTEHRHNTKSARLHRVEGLLIAIADIDEVIQVIRSSDNAEIARTRLMAIFDLSEDQAEYILELRLRRLTKFSRIELETERDELRREIEQLEKILSSDSVLRDVVSEELAEVSARLATPRRTVLLEEAGISVDALPGAPSAGGRGARSAPSALEVEDGPTFVLLSGTDLVARLDTETPPARDGERRAHDALRSMAPGRIRGQVGFVTSTGRVIRDEVVGIPALVPVAGAPGLSGGLPASELLALPTDEEVVGIVSLNDEATPILLATAQGIVKRTTAADFPTTAQSFDIISLKEGDRVVAVHSAPDDSEIVLIASDAQLLHFSASLVRPQGRSGGGIAGIKLQDGAEVIGAYALAPHEVSDAVVVTVSGQSGMLPGTVSGRAKVTPFQAFPGKGRATGGVRSQRFLAGEDCLQLAWVGVGPRAVAGAGQAVELPEVDERRDGSGSPLSQPIAAIG